jgi:cytochrome c biogenesis protein CcmG, thiol:disulfide interchange protein DsbE
MTIRLTVVAFVAACLLLMPAVGADRPAPAVGHAAPAFTRADVEVKKRSLAEFRGRRVALFFFCGCSWCAEVARAWGPLQRSGALEEKGGKAPITVVVYEGDAEPLRALAASAGLDPAQTALLPDPERTVASTYHAEPCPRVFVLDSKGVIRYTNRGKDDAPRNVPAIAIVSKTVDALRAATNAESVSVGTGGTSPPACADSGPVAAPA